MEGRHQRGYDPAAVPPAKRLRRNIEDLFAGNDVSGVRSYGLLQDAQAAGVRDCRVQRTIRHPNNIPRSMRARLLKGSLWPRDYVAKVRTWDPKAETEVVAEVHLLLPHEVLAKLVTTSEGPVLADRAGMDEISKSHLEGLPGTSADLLGLGIWGDAAPCKWDRSESLQVISWNLPGLTGHWRNLRFPFAGIAKKNLCTPATHHDLMAVFAWSMQACASGTWPGARHDGGPFLLREEPGRAKLAGKPLGLRAAVAEIRGDWQYYKEAFCFAGWSELAGCCYRCAAGPQDIRDCGLEASWRRPENRLTHWELLRRIRANGLTISPLFACPWVDVKLCKIDWLHCMDQGVAQNFLGSFFMELVRWPAPRMLAGGTMKLRCQALWGEMHLWYQATGVKDTLQNLTLTMLQQRGKQPKLRANAAQVRALVPFACVLAQRLLVAHRSQKELAILTAARLLYDCYRSLSSQTPDRAELLDRSSRRLALQLVALERVSPNGWRFKPKVHLMQELAMERADPSKSWVYRDEDWGGTAAKLSRRRGGMFRPKGTSRILLSRFRMKSRFPRIL